MSTGPIHSVIVEGREDEVRTWLNKKGINVDERHETQFTPLTVACFHQHLTIAELLLQFGADANFRFLSHLKHKKKWNHIQDLSLIDIAILNHDIDMVGLLLQFGAQLDSKKIRKSSSSVHKDNKYKSSSLHIAVALNQLEIVKVLVTAGIDLQKRDEHNHTALHIAALNGYIDIAEFLIKVKPRLIELTNRNETTPLHLAAFSGHNEVAKLLIARGADVNIQNEKMRSPLLHSLKQVHLDIAKILLKNGANVNANSLKEGSPLIYAIKHHNKNMKLINFLLEHKADVNLESKGLTPLYHACESGNMELIRTLITNGAVVNTSNPLLLCCACKNGNMELVKFLVEEHGIAVDQPTSDGFFPICFACLHGDISTIQYLLEKGADVKHRNYVSPIISTCIKGHKEVAKLLVREGARVPAMGFEMFYKLYWKYKPSKKGYADLVTVARRLIFFGASPRGFIGKNFDKLVSANNLDAIEFFMQLGAITTQTKQFFTQNYHPELKNKTYCSLQMYTLMQRPRNPVPLQNACLLVVAANFRTYKSHAVDYIIDTFIFN